MSRGRTDGTLFVGRLNKNTRVKDLEDIFESYGRLTRCDIKYGGGEMAYGFIDFEDRRDAEDALRYENGRSVCGSSIIVEWAKGTPRVGGVGGGGGGRDFECYKCGRPGHMARDCTNEFGYGSRGGGRTGPRDRYRDRSDSRDRSRRSGRSRSR